MMARERTGLHAIDLKVAAFFLVVVLGGRYGAASLCELDEVHVSMVD